MAEYYFRTDGAAANLAACIGPASNASACGDKALLEGLVSGDIDPLDEINLSNLGGEWTDVELEGDQVSGTLAGGQVTIKGDSTYNTTLINVGILLLNGLTNDVEHLIIEDLWAESTFVTTDSTAVFRFQGTVGNASLTSVDVIGCKARCLGDDGFSQTSGGGTGHINYTNTDTVDCGSGRPGGSHQGWTAHDSTASATLTNCDSTGDLSAISFVGGATAKWVSGTISGSLEDCIVCNQSGSQVDIESGVTINIDAGSSAFDCDDAEINFNGPIVSITDQNSDSFLRGTATVTINGGSWTPNDAGAQIDTVGGSTPTFTITNGAVINPIVHASGFINIDSSGATFAMNGGSKIDCTLMTSTNPVIRVHSDATVTIETSLLLEIDGVSASDIIDITSSATGDNINIRHNVIYNATSGGNLIDDESTNGCHLDSNIFYNVSTIDRGTAANIRPTYNCYYNSENLGGTGSITTDPLFTNAAGEDFTLQASSLCIGAGDPARPISTDAAGETYASPPSMGAYEYIAEEEGASRRYQRGFFKYI